MPPQDLIDKIPPQNTEAEMAVLGSMILSRDAIPQAIELVHEGSFYKDAHRKIYSSIINLYDSNRAVDIITLIEEMKKIGALDDAGGPGYMTTLASCVTTAANISHYARIVKEKHILRTLIDTSTQIVQESHEPEVDVDSLLDKAERLVFDITQDKIEGTTVSLKDMIRSSIETIDNVYQKKENITS